MADNEPTISMAGINAPPLYRLVEDGDKTVIMTADTNTPMWVINGDIAGGAKPMTTAERTAITPSEGELIYDTDLGSVYVGDGVTTGGVAIGSGGGGGTDYVFSNEFTVAGETVSIASVSASKITGKVGSAGVADALVNGATVGYAQSAGTAATATTATTAATANGVTQTVKDDIISSAGGGLDGEIASVDEVMTGITGGTTAVVDVSGLRGALTAGQAVDVTSQPDNVTDDWKEPFNWTDGYLGFDNSFPKYAAGLTYLLIADLTYIRGSGDDHIFVSPSGTWLDGTTTAIRFNGGETKRVAMLFSSRTGKLTVDEFDIGDEFEVSHLREYEVTVCSNDAIAYIAALSNPDAFASYYLVKQDMVQPWTYIIDMETSPAVTIASGLSYKLNAATGTHQLTVDTCPAGYDGRDAIIRIRLGGSGVIQAVAPLQLGGALVPYAINNCVVRFRDGEAVLLVEDTLAGYVVTLTSGTGEGSLAYGLAKATIPYIAFSTSTDGQVVDMGNAVTANKEVSVVGNGYEDTILTGSITCTSKTIMANLSLSDVQVKGGTMTLGDVFIPSGSTLAVSGGRLAIEKVTGNGGVIDLGNTYVEVGSNRNAMISGCILSGGSASGSGAQLFAKNGGVISAENVTFTGWQSGGYAANVGAFLRGAKVYLTSCTFPDPWNVGYVTSGTIFLDNCTFNPMYGNSVINLQSAASAVLTGSNAMGKARIVSYGSNGFVTISSGAVVDLTGNTNVTPIDPVGGIVVSGGCTVINSAGSSVSIAGGTYTKIKNDGTTA